MEDGILIKKEDENFVPHNIEAEQALLGTILVNNDVYEQVAHSLKSSHFFEPLHQKIFEIISNKIQKNSLASPVTIKSYFENDPSLEELGGSSYLVKLAGLSISSFVAKDLAKIIEDNSKRRNLINLAKEISSKASKVELENDPEEQITEAEQALYILSEQGKVERGWQPFISATNEAIKIANIAYQRDGQLSGLSTGLVDLDKKLGGLNPSDLLIIAGRPSMGKTALATNIAFDIAKKSIITNNDERDINTVGFFSLEMSSAQLAARILSESSKVPSDQIRRGEMTEEEFKRFVKSAQLLEKCPLFIDDTPALPISAIAARSRRLKRTQGLDLLIVDYLQLVRPSSTKESRVNEVSEITQGLKAIAKELNIPVIALSQLSRQVENREDKRPQLSDLRESGSIEQDADVVMFVFREEYYKEREKPGDHDVEETIKWQEEMSNLHGKAEIIIGKQRHGPIGTVELSFEGKYTLFGNLAKTYQFDQNKN